MVDKPISILHYAGPPVIGGVESTIYYHARFLSEAGYPVRVITGKGEGNLEEVAFINIPELSSSHPEVIFCQKELADGKVTTRFYSLVQQISEKLSNALSESPLAIVHNVLSLHKNLAFSAALKQLSSQGLRIVSWSHDFAWQDSIYLDDLHPGFPWDLIRSAWPGVEYVVVSEDRRKQLSALIGLSEEKIRVIYPGVDVDRFLKISSKTHTLAEINNLYDAEPMLLLPARITRRKNIELAIKTMGEICKSKPKSILVVTGPPGPHNPTNQAYLEELRKLKSDLGVERHILFLYEMGEDQRPFFATDRILTDLYQLADALFFPSKQEGFGIPILEAGLTRLPIFASDIAPFRESAGNDARLFPLDRNPITIAQEITNFLDHDPAYRMRKRVIKHFRWQSIIQNQIIPLIEALYVTKLNTKKV